MSMHMIQGVQVHGKSKKKKAPGWKQRAADHEAFMKKMGVTGKKSEWRAEIPEYKTRQAVPTSDVICSNGSKKKELKYTGNEIAGFVVTHKSNSMPIRKDNMQAAKDAASMRR